MKDDAIKKVAEALKPWMTNGWTARNAAEALANAGLLPTEAEWGTETTPGTVVPWPNEEQARRMHALVPTHPLRVRYVLMTPWKDAS